MAQILNREDAQNVAKQMVEKAQEQQNEKKHIFEDALKSLSQVKGDEKGYEGVALLLALPEDRFAILAPVFLAELEQSMRNTNDQLAMAQIFNTSGIRVEDITAEYQKLCDEVDNQMSEILSAQKRSFLKNLLAITYNAVSETEGITKRNILIPIEYCREDAKMPAYAHLTDAGMDVFATEEITINPGETKLIPLGIKVALPIGYALLIHPRSGMSLKTKMRICNSIGLIDAGYRGEIGVIVENIDPNIRNINYSFDVKGKPVIESIEHGAPIHIAKGERFAQMRLVEVPKAVFYEVDNVEKIEGNRNSGFGGTGQF